MKKIGILTGGADCPGLNSVIRSVARAAIQEGYVVTGIKNGWCGLIDGDMRVLDLRSVSGILARGGTILGTSRFKPPLSDKQYKEIAENYKRSGIDAVVAVGGEDTLRIGLDLYKQYSVPVIGVPKSIDNALSGTDYAFGFDTAVNVATECIDRLHTTAESHHRIIVIEVMGLHTGWIALESGIAGGANIILVPEYPVNIDDICETLKNRYKRGKSFSLIVISEGTKIKGYNSKDHHAPERRKVYRPSSVGELLASLIEEKTEYETRVSVLGHIQRGGTPTAYDRLIGTQFGAHAVTLVKHGDFGKMVSLHNNKLRAVSIEDAVKKRKTIDKELYSISKIFSA